LTEEGKGERVSENILTLIIEVTGEKKKGKEAKVATARYLWVLAVNRDTLRKKREPPLLSLSRT